MNQFYEVSHNREVIDIRLVFKEKNDKMKIFCPECKQAKLFIRGTAKAKTIIDQPTSKHAETCSYNLRHLNPKEAKIVFSNNNIYKIDEQLKEIFDKRMNNDFIGNVTVNYQAKTKTLIKTMQLINVEDITSAHLNNANVYYGRADVELIKSQRGYIIKLSAVKSHFQYFIINVSENTYKHLDEEFKKSKGAKEIKFMYYGILTTDNKNWKISTLVNSKYFLFK